jgi:GTP pyrophosphokinase
MVPLKYQLRNGDVIEILTSPNHTPSKDWLKIVKTPRARGKIRQWIKPRSGRAASPRKEICWARNPEIRAECWQFAEMEEMTVTKRFGLNTPIDLMAEIGFGKSRLISADETAAEVARRQSFRQADRNRPLPMRWGGKVRGVEDIMTRYARCCNPVPRTTSWALSRLDGVCPYVGLPTPRRIYPGTYD